MGCWNETCMLSNLPIEYGDEIVVIPLIQDNQNEIFYSYYPADNYLPLPPVVGKYNNYGNIENIDFSNNLLHLYQSLPFKRLENEKYIDINITAESFEDFIRNICKNRHQPNKIFFNRGISAYSIDFYMCHKKIYDRITKYILLEFEQRTFYDIKKEIDLYHAHMNPFEFRLHEEPYLRFWIREALDCKLDDKYCLNTAIEMTAFHTALDILRKGYKVISGLGSQNSDWDVYKEFHKMISEFIDYKIQYWKELQDE